MNQSEENVNTKLDISIEGKMREKDAGKVAIIMAWGKSISMIIGSCGGVAAAIISLIKDIL